MTRLLYGGGVTDVYLVPDAEGDLHSASSAVVQFFNASVGGSQYTDLRDLNNQAISQVVTSDGTDGHSAGQIPNFLGPDGVFEMWASANGSPRFLMVPNNLGSYLGPTKAQLDAHLLAANLNPHGSRVRDLSDVDTTDVAAAAPGDQLAMGPGGMWLAQRPLAATGWFNVLDYGATGDGTTDDTAAILAAIAAIPTQGGVLYFPPGTYVCSATLSVNGRRGIIMAGCGGRVASPSNPSATLLKWTGSGAGRFIDARSTLGFQMRDLLIWSTSNTFTGAVVDVSGTSVAATAMATFHRCNIYVASASTCAGVDVNWLMTSRFESCHFTNTTPAIRGRGVAADQANAISVVDCVFDSIGIKNPGQGWTVDSCTFEGPATDVAQAIYHDAGVTCEGLIVRGCWSGDTTSGVQYQVAGVGIVFQGNWIGATGGTGIYVDEASYGMHIAGNKFRSCTDGLRIATGSSHYMVCGNEFQNVTRGIDQITPTGHTNYMVFANHFATVTTPYVSAQQPLRIDENLANPAIIIHNTDTTTDGRATIRFQADRTSVKAYDIGIDPNGTGTISKGFTFYDRTAGAYRGLITTGGSWVLAPSTGDMATTATDGFTYLPASVGANTAVPTAISGAIPIHFDRTSPGKIKAYVSGAWREFTTTLTATATLDFPSIATGRTGDLTMTCTGAAVGDPVAVSSPASFSGVLLYAFVSAADTITVRLFNATASSVDASSSSFTVKVFK